MFKTNYNEDNEFTKIVPIDDIDPKDKSLLLGNERPIRCKFASLFRLVDLFGWSHSMYNHITVRLSESNRILINPFGVLYSEITASNLVIIDLNGQIIDSGLTDFGINKSSSAIHIAIHSSRKDANCIIHSNTAPIVAVSSMQCGLLYTSQEAITVGDVSYFKYNGIDLSENMTLLSDSLGKNKVMFLQNHGVICVGSTIEEAFFWLYNIFYACLAQVNLINSGICDLKVAYNEGKVNLNDKIRRGYERVSMGGTINWKLGELEFEAHMRMLDRLSYRTGYSYKYTGRIFNKLIEESTPVNENKVEFKNKKDDYSEESSLAYSVDSGTHILLGNEPFGFDSEGPSCLGSNDELDKAKSLGSFCESSGGSVPKSESSKEMIICYGFQSQPISTTENSIYSAETESQSQSTTQRTIKSKREAMARRSKSLTSGVERAIYRRIYEKYRCDTK